MTDQKQPDFLGDGPRFNKVGSDHSTPNDPAASDTGPILVPDIRSWGFERNLAAIIVLLILAAVVFYLSDRGLGGVEQKPGRGGLSTPKPDINPDALPR